MRLWHEALLPYLPRAQLLGQHRECCALRGLAWGRRHAVVDYVFTHSRERLAVYHARVMREMERRGYRVESCWKAPGYRGRRCAPFIPERAKLPGWKADIRCMRSMMRRISGRAWKTWGVRE